MPWVIARHLQRPAPVGMGHPEHVVSPPSKTSFVTPRAFGNGRVLLVGGTLATLAAAGQEAVVVGSLKSGSKTVELK